MGASCAFDPSRESLRSYLLKGGHDVSIAFLRRDIARSGRGGLEEAATGDPGSTIESELHGLEAAARVAEALVALDSDQRDAIVSAFYGGLSYQDIAAESGLAPAAIRSAIRRGLLRIEHALRNLGSVMMA